MKTTSLRYITTILLVTLVLLAPLAAGAQNGYMAAMRNKVQDGYNFWLYEPQEYVDHPDEVFPVIIFLHGQSLCGNDMNRSLRYGVMDAINMGRHVEALVITPQNPGGSWKPDKINNVLDWVLDNYRADQFKVYVLGMSLGGYGTMDFAATYPHKIAAAMALCGGCSLKDVQGLGQLPFWIMHGTADAAINISKSKRVVQELQDYGNTSLLRYDWIPGASHGRLARVFYLEETYQWLLQHDKERNPHHVDRDIIINDNTMQNAYQGLKPRDRQVTTVSTLTP